MNVESNNSEVHEGLSKSELQSLKSLLKYRLNVLHYDLTSEKFFAKMYYEEADPLDKFSGEYYFKLLNQSKNNIRSIKREINDLSNIQRKIKKLC